MPNLLLTRVYIGPEGAFSTLAEDNKPPFAVALEHTYGNDVKLPVGKYTCRRGLHQLKNGPPFITFEVMDVPGHSGILFHKGNVEDDSEGCILLGLQFGNIQGQPAVMQSASAFIFFMSRQSDVDSFTLEVRNG